VEERKGKKKKERVGANHVFNTETFEDGMGGKGEDGETVP